jgi:hypothetical protein
MRKNKYLESKDMLGHVALVIAFYEKRQLAGMIRWRNRGIWADDRFAFAVQQCFVRSLHEEK